MVYVGDLLAQNFFGGLEMRFKYLHISLCCCLLFLNACNDGNRLDNSAIESIFVLNREISNTIAYGVGPVFENRNPTEEEILTYGEGHCGMYAYLFAKQLSMQGIESHTVDIRRFDGAAHSVVEVDIDGKVYTFDPTLGVYYQAGVKDLVDNPNFELLKMGNPVRLPEYASATFWSGVRQLVYYSDVRDFYDRDLLKCSSYSIYSNCSLAETENEMVASLENEESFVQIEFERPCSFYRIKFYWNTIPDTSLAVRIEAVNADGTFQTVYNCDAETGKAYFSYTLPSKIAATTIRIFFPDTAPEIAQLQIFE